MPTRLSSASSTILCLPDTCVTFLDRCKSPAKHVAGVFRAKDVTDVRDIGLGDAPDQIIADYAQSNGMAIVTRDGDFGDIRNYPPQEYSGILVVDVPDHFTAAQVAAILAAFLDASPTLDVNHKLIVLEPSRVRVREATP